MLLGLQVNVIPSAGVRQSIITGHSGREIGFVRMSNNIYIKFYVMLCISVGVS